jgi:hypothetical protein
MNLCLDTLDNSFSPLIFLISNVIEPHFQQCVRYNVEHGLIPDTLLKMLLNTNKTVRHIIHNSWNIVDSGANTNKNGHHVLHYTWHIVESVVQ